MMSTVLEEPARPRRFVVPCPLCTGGEPWPVHPADQVDDTCMLCSGFRQVPRVVAERYRRDQDWCA